MTRALILVHPELSFSDQAKELERYLRDEVGLRRHAVCRQQCCEMEPDDLAWTIDMHSAKANRQPLLLAYFGHGYPDGWSYGYRSKDVPLQISYDQVGAALRGHRGPLLVINECCYAGKIQDQLTWIGGDRVPVGLLAACGAEEPAYGDMARDILAFWRASKPYAPVRRKLFTEPHQESRWGAELDHHFFAKP